ncbi:MAG: TfoX family protein [Gammaproteobacteria bacterium]|nr:MAG: TfoX family protein [Gammaproteobacteria bacterium]
MPVSKQEQEFAAYTVDLMQSMGPVHAKRMFGGYGIYLEDLMFALIADNTLYLKADTETRQHFTDRGLQAFSYDKQGKTYTMSYYQAPEEALEDGDMMTDWANLAYHAAIRASLNKRKK